MLNFLCDKCKIKSAEPARYNPYKTLEGIGEVPEFGSKGKAWGRLIIFEAERPISVDICNDCLKDIWVTK